MEDQPNPNPPALVPTVKTELEDAINFLELQMENVLGEVDEEQSLDDFPPPVLQPEITLANQEVPVATNPQTEGGGVQGSLWYQCNYCSVLLEDAMVFLFHLRLHEGSESLENDMDSIRLETQLTQAGVTIFSPAVVTSRVDTDANLMDETEHNSTSVRLNLPPMPTLTRAPSTGNPYSSQSLEDLPRKCKLCVPHLNFNRRSEFIDHLFMQHRIEKEFHCSKPRCTFRTRSVQFLEKHVDEHMELESSQSRIYICHLCSPKTKWPQSTRYAWHMRDHLAEDGKFHCVYCRYATPGLQLFNKHIKNRHPEHTSATDGVPGVLKPRPRSIYYQPTRRIPIDRQFLCYYCSKSWISRKKYETHMILRHRTSRGGYNCNKCKFVAESIRLIARHFRFKHGIDNSRKNFTQVDGPKNIEVDMDTDEQEEAELNDTPLQMGYPIAQAVYTNGPRNPLCLPTTPVNQSKMTCPLCNPDKTTDTPQTFTSFDHIFQTHCRDNAIFCPRPNCSFRSISLETTVFHLTTAHAPPKVHQLKNGTSSSGTGKMNYLCRFCKSNWTEVSAYSQHMKQHLDQNGNFVCPHCYLPYPTLNRFNEHVKRRHEMAQPRKQRAEPIPKPLVLPKPIAKSPTEVKPQPKPPLLKPSVTTFTPMVTRRVRPRPIGTRRRRLRGPSGYMKKSYACFYCDPDGLSFQSVKLYSRHMRELHMNPDGSYSCPICPSVEPTTLKKLNEHMKRKSHPPLMKKAKSQGRLPLSYSFQDEDEDRGADLEMEDQMMKIDIEKKEQIDSAEAWDIRRQSLERVEIKVEEVKSESTSVGKKWFQCKACFILVETKEKLIVHQRIHHQASLTHGYERSQPTRVKSEKIHCSPSRSPSSPSPKLSPQMPLHKCKTCYPPRRFRSQALLDEHMAQIHQTESSSTPTTPAASTTDNGDDGSDDLPKSGRKMTCLFCYIVFTKQSTYIKHMNDEHTDESGYFHCPTCLIYSSPLLSRATKHMRRHFKPDKPPVRHKKRSKVRRGVGGRAKVKTVDVGTAVEGLKVNNLN